MSDIRLRRSDVLLAAGDALRQGADAARNIFDINYEAERVSQVNRQLTYLEQAYQTYNTGIEQRSFTSYADQTGTIARGGFDVDVARTAAAGIEQPFGQATLADVQRNGRDFLEQQLEYIARNTPNKAARQEMTAHLQAKHLQNQAAITQRHQVAAQHEYFAGLSLLGQEILKSGEPYSAQVAQHQSRLDEGVAVGRVFRDDAIRLQGTFKNAVYNQMLQDLEIAVEERNHDGVERMIASGLEAGIFPDEDVAAEMRTQLAYAIDVGLSEDFVKAVLYQRQNSVIRSLEVTGGVQGLAEGDVRDTPGPELVALLGQSGAERMMMDLMEAREANDGVLSIEKLMEVRATFLEDSLSASVGLFAKLEMPEIQAMHQTIRHERDNARREYERYTREQDNELDERFSTLNLEAQSVNDIDAALGELKTVEFYDAIQKYNWQQRLTQHRDRMLRDLPLPKDLKKAQEEWMEANEDWLHADLSLRVNTGELSQSDAIRIVEDKFRVYNEVRPAFVSAFVKDFQAEENPYYAAGLQYLRSKLDGDELLDAVTRYRRWFDSEENVTIDESVAGAKHISEPIIDRITSDFLTNFRVSAFGERADRNTLSSLEKTTQQIMDGDFLAISGLSDNREFMNQYATDMLRVGQDNYGYLDLNFVWIDYDREFTGRAGTALLRNTGTGRSYAFLVDENVHVLHGLNDDGTWSLVPTAPPPTAARPAEPITETLTDAQIRQSAELARQAALEDDEEQDPVDIDATQAGFDLLRNAPGRQ